MNPKCARLGLVLLSAILGAGPAPAAGEAASPVPPVAKKVPKTTTVHGVTLVDDYAWLREKANPDVKAYLEAENAYADAVMKGTEELQKRLYDEMLSRIKETDLSAPVLDRGYWYYTRTEKGKQYPIRCRRKGSLDAPEEVLLDLNEMAKGERFLSVGDFEVSDDGTKLAYTKDVTGFREYTLKVRDLLTGKDGPESVAKVSSVAWAADGKTLFYVTDDAAKRPYRLFRHVVGSAGGPGVDALVHEEKDEMYVASVGRTRSRAFVTLSLGSHTSSEWRLVPAGEPEGAFRVVLPREKEHEYDLDHRGDTLFLRTNRGCRNFRLVTAPVADPSPASWKEVVPCREDVMTAGVDVFRDFQVVYERENALPRLRVVDAATGAAHRIELPEELSVAYGDANPEFATGTFRFSYQSMVTPPSIYDYDVKTRERKLLKRQEVLGGYDPAGYVTERVWATASDGTKVPVSLLYRKGLARDGSAPMLLMGYGSYGAPMAPTFASNRLVLLDRGFVYGIAHVRGGGELGKRWHDQGRMLSKKNSFTDFVACAEAVVAQRYTSKDRLAIEGGSAGGLLMGAVTNLSPGHFAAVISRVPFVDVVNTMLDESLPLTVGEFEEWGNPKKREEFDYLLSYSPYDNLKKGAYPAILVKTSFDDSQVMYWEPAKYVARLRTLKTNATPLLFRTNMAGGHGGSSGRYDRLKEAAFDDAFLLRVLGREK
ncbi:S9 family peptidase [Acidobacteria bacterium ACD]|nr:MAG: S9 family peptidase [Acidobacteriota bacterium]MCE7956853.1 S9 family peptidase [Acidobacteria bacterium ACB2]MDL1948501.1 S9 family peptidase [Acidobacteria bacterium ACD]